MDDSQKISDFYQLMRGYWERLTLFKGQAGTGMLNFGYWPAGVLNLHDAQLAFVQRIVDALAAGPGPARGLEIGCGAGGVSIHVLKRLPQVHLTGLDISEPHLSLAAVNAGAHGVAARFGVTRGDAMALPVADAAYDFNLCIESSFHYPDKPRFFSESQRSLKPGGVLVLADITCARIEGIRFRDGNHFESVDTYGALATAAGFELQSVHDIGPQVYAALHEHILAFNRTERSKAGKYWAMVLSNYRTLAQAGEMGYHVFVLRKRPASGA